MEKLLNATNYLDNKNIYKNIHCSDKAQKYFINKYHLDKNYANVKLSFDSNLRSDYDAYSNPVFHLINKDGIFLSKKTSAITLKKYFK